MIKRLSFLEHRNRACKLEFEHVPSPNNDECQLSRIARETHAFVVVLTQTRIRAQISRTTVQGCASLPSPTKAGTKHLAK